MICSREFVIKKMTELLAEPKKKYSQNFLTDHYIVKETIDSLELKSDTAVIEIGPGLGALTEEVINRGNQIHAFEIDEVMVNHLSSYFERNKNFHIYKGDFLKQDLSFLSDRNVVFVSNIPYSLTTPIIEKVLLSRLNVSTFTFMIQKEVAARINAKIKTKEYSPLSIFISYLGKVNTVVKVTRDKFIPAPNVDSIVLRIVFRNDRDFDKEKRLYSLLNACFAMRRKNLLNNLTQFLKSKDKALEVLSAAHIEPTLRAEQLSLENFLSILEQI